MENGATKLSTTKGALKWVAVGAAFAILAPTAVQAAAQAVKVTNQPTIEKINKAVKVAGPIKVNGTTTIPQQGLFGTNPVPNVMRNQEAPVSFLGAGDCLNTGDALGQAQASNVTIPADGGRTLVTGILITGRSPLPTDANYTPPNGSVYVNTDAVPSPAGGNAQLLEATVNEANPNELVSIDPPLALTAPLHFEGRAPGGGNSGDCQFVVLGHGRFSEFGQP